MPTGDNRESSLQTDRIASSLGVSESRNLSALLPKHREILFRVMRILRSISVAEANTQAAFGFTSSGEKKSYKLDVRRREPIITFLIDGVRGAGKTSLALTIRRYINLYSIEQAGGVSETDEWGEIFAESNGAASPTRLKEFPGNRTSFHTLPMLKPDDMDVSESIMEAIFAQMLIKLKISISELEASETDERRLAEARKLRDRLNNDVAKGWYFAKRLGVEALLNDSMSFEDYIDRRADEASSSHNRVNAWREFVVDYLDFYGSQMLGIFIDDTDISRHLVVDLLHSIRMFFGHPRIFSVVAANLHTTRQRLLADTMSELSDAFRTLRTLDSYTASFWREFERDNLEEYLAKVFPRQLRNFIKLGDQDIRELLNISPDQTTCGDNSFIQFCTSQMSSRVTNVLRNAKETKPLVGYHIDFPSTRFNPTTAAHVEPRPVEDYLALWLLRNHYAAQLTPRSARHLNQFTDMIAQGPLSQNAVNVHRRRVAVAIFTEPLNFQIVQRLTDHDSNVMDWINSQTVSSNWRGGRELKINKLTLTPKSPSYHYILFRLDLEFAKPDHANQNANFPMSLLPEPSGRKVWTPEIWQLSNRDSFERALRRGNSPGTKGSSPRLRLRQDLQGLARTFSSPVIPANCLYLKDLRALPDLAWAWNTKQLDHRRAFGQFPVRHADNTFRLLKTDPRDDYFQQVVLLYSSFPLMSPVPPNEFVVDASALIDLELCNMGLSVESTEDSILATTIGKRNRPLNWINEGASLLAEPIKRVGLGQNGPLLSLNSEQHRGFSTEALADEAVRLGLRDVDTTEKNQEDTTGGSESYWRRKRNKLRETGELVPSARFLAEDVVAIVPRYTRIMNDVRRAYHALRILERDLNDYAFARHFEKPNLEKKAGSVRVDNAEESRADDQEGLAFASPFIHSNNDRYRLIGVQKFRAVLGLANFSDTEIGNQHRNDGPLDARYSIRDEGDNIDSAWGMHLDETRTNGEKESITTTKICWDNNSCEVPLLEIAAEENRKEGEEKSEYRIKIKGQEIEDSKFIMTELAKLFTKNDVNYNKNLTIILNTRRTEDSKRSRVLRSRLLFLWGIGPCLSSLIHLDVMGRLYDCMNPEVTDLKQKLNALYGCWYDKTDAAEKQTDKDPVKLGQQTRQFENEIKLITAKLQEAFQPEGKAKFAPTEAKQTESAKQVAMRSLTNWQSTLATAEALVYLFARALEVNYEDDFKSVSRKKIRDDVNDDLPDSSSSTETKSIENRDAVKFRPLPDMSISTLGIRLIGKECEPVDDESYFGGIVYDTITRLQLAQIYSSILRERLNCARVKDDRCFIPANLLNSNR